MRYTIIYSVISISIFVITLFSSCNKNKTIIGNLEQIAIDQAFDYYNIDDDIYTWDTDRIINQKDLLLINSISYSGGKYYLSKRISDTSLFLAFEFYYSEFDTIFSPTELYKRYESDLYQHIILLGKNQDTLFHYKAALYRDLHKTFISGKYYYQYLFNQLSKEQRYFFKAHKDSLIRIKGHNLEPLPDALILR